MNDADRTIDVSLETDRLEQLLEVPPPAPSQPVVMIEYRNRGVPWWLVVSLILLVPLVAVLCYQQFIVKEYQKQAADARYRVLQAANEKAAEPVSRQETPAPDPAVSNAVPGPAPIVITAEPARSPDENLSSQPAGTSGASPQPARPDSSAGLKVADTAEPSGPRVRTLLTPLESVGTKPEPKGAAAPAPAAGPNATTAKPVRDDSANTKLAAAPVQPGAASAPHDTPKSKDAGLPPAAPAGTIATPPAGGPPAVPAVAPLPTPEEFRAQIEEEAARKNAEKVDLEAELVDRERVRRYEDRVRFHEELSHIIEAPSGKTVASEIDALAKRFRGVSDPKMYAKGKRIWRDSRVPQAVRVQQIRTLGIAESDILDFISDNLNEVMRSRNGPRNQNDLRVRAARLLLKYPVPEELGAPAAASDSSTMPKERKARELAPQ